MLTPAEWEALRFGYRERVGDMQHAHIRNLPDVLPGLIANAAAPYKQAGFGSVIAYPRTPPCHDGVVYIHAHQHAMTAISGSSLDNR